MMSTYQRLQGLGADLIARKRGKKLQQKRRKEKMRRRQSHDPSSIDTSQFMGVDFEDSVFIPEIAKGVSSEQAEDGNVVIGVKQ